MSGSLVLASMATAGQRPFSSNLGAKTGASSTVDLSGRPPNVRLLMRVRDVCRF